ncbi:MAG TPA: carboxypeptidase-like regulatory domain-containing protein [Pyrinomonadaceae bacterium]|nr:carboxypeptidase-like regulatory domain-containing protein [Pyrinomonadaceae bacterium]
MATIQFHPKNRNFRGFCPIFSGMRIVYLNAYLTPPTSLSEKKCLLRSKIMKRLPQILLLILTLFSTGIFAETKPEQFSKPSFFSNSTNNPLFKVRSSSALGPVTLAGRIYYAKVRPLPNAVVSLWDAFGHVYTTKSNSFGYYRFDNFWAGNSYFIFPSYPGCTFPESPLFITPLQSEFELNFECVRTTTNSARSNSLLQTMRLTTRSKNN